MAVNRITAAGFPGVNNKLPPEALVKIDRGNAASFFVDAVNIDVNDAGGFSRRRGFTQTLSGSCHSAWSSTFGFYVVVDDELCLFNPTAETTTPILSVSLLPISYAQAHDRVCFSNGQIIGWLKGDQYGLYERVGTYDRTAQFLDPSEDADYYDTPPPGNEIEFFAGRLWVAGRDAVWYTKPFFLDRVDYQHDYLPWENARMLGAVRDGMYLGLEKEVWFLGGTDPKSMQPVKVCNFGVVAGTKTYIDADKFAIDGAAGLAVVWESPRGKVLGMPGGRVLLMTDKNVSYNPGDRGASLLREFNGITQHVSAFKAGGDGSSMRASDTASAEIRRNGVVI